MSTVKEGIFRTHVGQEETSSVPLQELDVYDAQEPLSGGTFKQRLQEGNICHACRLAFPKWEPTWVWQLCRRRRSSRSSDGTLAPACTICRAASHAPAASVWHTSQRSNPASSALAASSCAAAVVCSASLHPIHRHVGDLT